jgi:hypothetical protein
MSMMPITERHPTFRLTRGYLKLRWMESLWGLTFGGQLCWRPVAILFSVKSSRLVF